MFTLVIGYIHCFYLDGVVWKLIIYLFLQVSLVAADSANYIILWFVFGNQLQNILAQPSAYSSHNHTESLHLIVISNYYKY